MKTILRAAIAFFVCVRHTVLGTVSMLNKKRIPIFNGSRKAVTFSLLLATFSLFLAAPKAYAQTSVNNFDNFIAITTVTNNYNISLTGNILFSTGGFSVLSGTITGNGYVLDGQNANAGITLSSGNSLFFYGPITFQNFKKVISSSGSAAQGGALFAAGAYNTYSNSTTMLDFTNATVNFTGNTVTTVSDYIYGSAAQGGGLFVGGAVSAGAYGGIANSSSGTAVVNFTSSIINFTSNTLMSGAIGSVAQGGGLFVGGAVSAGAFTGGTNNSSSGTAVVNFTSSTINFTSNMSTYTIGTVRTVGQGGGLFVGGAVSAGTRGTGVNNSGSGIAVVNFTSSTINFTSNTVTGENAAQGGGLFVGGAVSAGVGRTVINNSSSGTAVVNFTSSIIDFTGNMVQGGRTGSASQGGGLFVGGGSFCRNI
ncbi:hypothetical protein [Endomicrobium proavitum]|uniref:Uncharacterized protein n=1 Tax=Endomicrobium proavitum TaxID=1408281 RepID=A0A0G3WJ29_9BACT|nr:hypothetical protein [Endomicrobium proavitum]AKL97900.1 membrane protein of unknown function [Endomicrobium proavitum]